MDSGSVRAQRFQAVANRSVNLPVIYRQHKSANHFRLNFGMEFNLILFTDFFNQLFKFGHEFIIRLYGCFERSRYYALVLIISLMKLPGNFRQQRLAVLPGDDIENGQRKRVYSSLNKAMSTSFFLSWRITGLRSINVKLRFCWQIRLNNCMSACTSSSAFCSTAS